jgi:hypothetical protein
MERIRVFQSQSRTDTVPEVDRRVIDFIDERACLDSEGRDYTWVDPLALWTDCLSSFLQVETLTDELINDLICVLTLAPETEVEPREHGVLVFGPDPQGVVACDCLTAERIPVKGREPSLGDSS